MKRRIVGVAVVLGCVLALGGGTVLSGTGTGTGTGDGAGGMPFALAPLRAEFAGVAREVLQVRGYTYLAVAVEGAGAEPDVRWVASLKREIPPGARVRVRSFGARRSFRSAQLGRAFPELHFGAVTVVPVPDLPAEPMNRSKT